MPKDTKSSGYNKAPACESRGFGYKKEGANFDTPSFFMHPNKKCDVYQLFSGRNLRTTAPARHISLSRNAASSFSKPSR